MNYLRQVALSLLTVIGPATSAHAIDAACTQTTNLSIYRCPENSTDWYASYTGIVDNLDGLVSTGTFHTLEVLGPATFNTQGGSTTVKGILRADTGSSSVDALEIYVDANDKGWVLYNKNTGSILVTCRRDGSSNQAYCKWYSGGAEAGAITGRTSMLDITTGVNGLRIGNATTIAGSSLTVDLGGRGTIAKFEGDNGEAGYLSSFADVALLYNAEVNASGVVTARGTAASIFSVGAGLLYFTANTGLTAGNSFSPTEIMRVNTVGVGIGSISPGTKLHLSSGTLTVDGTSALIKIGDAAATPKAGQIIASPPAAQTIAAGNTITADACGGVKIVTAGGAVTTDTTNTITAPAAANAGCCMNIVNTGATNTITLDQNANNNLAADTALGPCDTIMACSTGASGRWYFGAVFAGTCN